MTETGPSDPRSAWPYEDHEDPPMPDLDPDRTLDDEAEAASWPEAGGSVDLDESMSEAVTELGRVRTEASKLRRDGDTLRGRVLDHMRREGAVRAFDTEGRPVAKLQVTHTDRVNQTKLAALYPEVFKAVVEDSVSITVRVL